MTDFINKADKFSNGLDNAFLLADTANTTFETWMTLSKIETNLELFTNNMEFLNILASEASHDETKNAAKEVKEIMRNRQRKYMNFMYDVIDNLSKAGAEKLAEIYISKSTPVLMIIDIAASLIDLGTGIGENVEYTHALICQKDMSEVTKNMIRGNYYKSERHPNFVYTNDRIKLNKDLYSLTELLYSGDNMYNDYYHEFGGVISWYWKKHDISHSLEFDKSYILTNAKKLGVKYEEQKRNRAGDGGGGW